MAQLKKKKLQTLPTSPDIYFGQQLSFINLADGSNSAFVANIHHLLGRRYQLVAQDSLLPLGELFEFGCEFLELFLCHLRRQCPTLPCSLMTALSVEFSLAIGQCTHPRGATCRWPPNSTCAIVVCCHCCFRGHLLSCALTVLSSVTIMWIEPLSTFFGHETICQCRAVFRIADLLSGLVPRSATFPLTFLTLHILHPQVCHINVLQSTNPLTVDDVFSGLPSMANTGFIS